MAALVLSKVIGLTGTKTIPSEVDVGDASGFASAVPEETVEELETCKLETDEGKEIATVEELESWELETEEGVEMATIEELESCELETEEEVVDIAAIEDELTNRA
jgi:hypothetical protein